MVKKPWLPKGYALADGSKIRSLLFAGDDWQIFDTSGASNVLLAHLVLAQRWHEAGFLDEFLFREVAFGSETFQSIGSSKKYTMMPVEDGQTMGSKVDALAFALALKESRKISEDASFHDAIYLEQYSKLLPTWTLTPRADDKTVLGIWLTSGVAVSTDSFRRLVNLTGWMPAGDLAEIVETAGFSVPPSASLLVKRKPAPQSKSGKEGEAADADGEPEKLQPQREEAQPGVFQLPGRPQLEAFFNEHVVDIIFNPERYQALGIDFPSAIVLHGPPGCGKTFAVEQLVEFIDWPSYSIDSGSIGSPYIHATSKKIAEVFDTAISNAPSVIVIDEMEAFLSDRQAGGLSGMHRVEEVAEFLRRIPEAVKSKVLIIAMTNLIDMIDPAILRRGRFDHIIEVSMPSRTEVTSLLDSLLDKLPKEAGLKLGQILDTLTGRALSDSAFVVREAARLAAKDGKSRLDQASMDKALNSLPKTKKPSKRYGFRR